MRSNWFEACYTEKFEFGYEIRRHAGKEYIACMAGIQDSDYRKVAYDINLELVRISINLSCIMQRIHHPFNITFNSFISSTYYTL